ncbi:MAG: TetR family transcriptional regulator [Ilumatobacteraceae bacterium]|nr:TetR family transcriptional regulator [Ilumatobacteraceae bacterium]
MIADAAHELGLEGLTLRAVADHLNVSISALYHYVDGSEDLMRAAAERSARAVPLPTFHGQTWAQWLLDWGHYNHAVFTTQPGLLGQYLEGAIGLDSVLPNLDIILGVLVDEGFTISQANDAYRLVSASALGLVIAEKREQDMATDAAGADAIRQLLKATPTSQLRNIRRLFKERRSERGSSFEQVLELVLRGIAVTYDLPWQPVVHHGRAGA